MPKYGVIWFSGLRAKTQNLVSLVVLLILLLPHRNNFTFIVEIMD